MLLFAVLMESVINVFQLCVSWFPEDALKREHIVTRGTFPHERVLARPGCGDEDRHVSRLCHLEARVAIRWPVNFYAITLTIPALEPSAPIWRIVSVVIP